MIKKSDDQSDLDLYDDAIKAYRILWDEVKDERSLERAVELVDIASGLIVSQMKASA